MASDTAEIRKAARIAGFLYLLVVITAPFGLVYVPGAIIVRGDATATANHIRASEWILRLGIASELVHQIIGIFVVLALFRLFRRVSEMLAWQVVILGALVSVPIMFLNVLNEIAALLLVSGAGFLSVFDQRQLDALAYLFLRLHSQGIFIAAIFWGLWLFPFGLLVMRSRFIPSVLGALLIVAGCAYLVSSFTTLIVPQYAQRVDQVALAFEICELPIVFWLVIWGARPQLTEPAAPR